MDYTFWFDVRDNFGIQGIDGDIQVFDSAYDNMLPGVIDANIELMSGGLYSVYFTTPPNQGQLTVIVNANDTTGNVMPEQQF